MPKFVFVGDHPVSVYQPEGGPDAIEVEPKQVVEVLGSIASETDDAYIVGDGVDARAWPKALWELDKPKSAVKATTEKENS